MAAIGVRRAVGVIVIAGAVLGARAARAATWAIDASAAEGIAPNVRDSFRQLLQDELAGRNRAAFVRVDAGCHDAGCTRAAAAQAGAQVAVHAEMNALGARILVSVTVVDVAGGEVQSSHRMSVDRVEDLEVVAARIAEAIVSGQTVDQTAEVGAITEKETRPDVRRKGSGGVTLRAVGMAPLGNDFADGTFGVGGDLGLWFEARTFAIEPRVGVRFAPAGKSGSYQQVPIDVAFQYLLSDGDVAPFLGIGAGINYLREKRTYEFALGRTVTSRSTGELDDSTWGFGTFGRVGLLLFRTYTMRLTLTADYGITFAKLNGRTNPQSFVFGIGVVL